MIEHIAPTNVTVVDYDQCKFLTYAEVLDADATGIGWDIGALSILGIDLRIDGDANRRCWHSRLARARWITGDGPADAGEIFNRVPFGYTADEAASR